jgi:NADH-quinone oxidoreductase subunit L
MMNLSLPLLILGPFLAGCLVMLVPQRVRFLKEALVIAATAADLVLCLRLFPGEWTYFCPWGAYSIDFSLRFYRFSAFILSAAGGFAFLIAVYSCVFMFAKEKSRLFFTFFLFSLSLVNGAVLSDNLIILLFFWEGLLLTVFGLIAIGGQTAFKTAVKALVIVGVADLCMMVGIALVGHLSGTFALSKIQVPLGGLGSLAFVLMMIGAISKAGSMPFHTWIPDASIDAPLPFMAFLPAALEKLLGIYLLARICLDLFQLVPESGLSMALMIIGSVTILLAVMMALIQKNYKRLLSYHAISQVGYMILGIGTAVPIGIVGGLFHMVNHAMYKSCLFLTSGAVERQTGTTDLERLGGLAGKMPVTFVCFFVAAAAISGVPPFNGFFSKELIYDGALERGLIFYLAAILGSFLTAASFLKLGHAAYLGPKSEATQTAKEAPVFMLFPMIVIAAGCVFFGLHRSFPIGQLVQPAVENRLEGQDFSFLLPNTKLVAVTVIMLLMAIVNHIFGAKMKGSGLKAVDYIHDAPILSGIYVKAEKGCFDPYEWVRALMRGFSGILWRLDRGIDWIYNAGFPGCAQALANTLRRWHSGSYVTYLGWSLGGLLILAVFLISTRSF